MRTATFTHETTIDRPAAEVWALLADYGNDPAWREGVRTMAPEPPGPVRPGTTTLEELRFAGRTMRIPGEVLTVEPGRSFTWRASRAEGRRTVEPLADDRCRVVLEMEVTLTTAERMMGPLLVSMLRRRVAEDLERLAALAGAGEPAALAHAAAA
jgi:uncharacterized protein YndB with AHSA1/START domain